MNKVFKIFNNRKKPKWVGVVYDQQDLIETKRLYDENFAKMDEIFIDCYRKGIDPHTVEGYTELTKEEDRLASLSSLIRRGYSITNDKGVKSSTTQKKVYGIQVWTIGLDLNPDLGLSKGEMYSNPKNHYTSKKSGRQGFI